MSTERARDALSQCLPSVFNETKDIGFRKLADRLDVSLEKRGFKIISMATYNRLSRTENQGDTSKDDGSMEKR